MNENELLEKKLALDEYSKRRFLVKLKLESGDNLYGHIIKVSENTIILRNDRHSIDSFLHIKDITTIIPLSGWEEAAR